MKVGELCILRNPWENVEIKSEVVGFTKGQVLLTAMGSMQGVSTATEVLPTHHVLQVGVGPGLLGRVLNGLGEPMDTETKGRSAPLRSIRSTATRPALWNAR